jgi:hypothetical protein
MIVFWSAVFPNCNEFIRELTHTAAAGLYAVAADGAGWSQAPALPREFVADF